MGDIIVAIFGKHIMPEIIPSRDSSKQGSGFSLYHTLEINRYSI
jgi:hypothetical protein